MKSTVKSCAIRLPFRRLRDHTMAIPFSEVNETARILILTLAVTGSLVHAATTASATAEDALPSPPPRKERHREQGRRRQAHHDEVRLQEHRHQSRDRRLRQGQQPAFHRRRFGQGAYLRSSTPRPSRSKRRSINCPRRWRRTDSRFSSRDDVMYVSNARSIQRDLIPVVTELPPTRPDRMVTTGHQFEARQAQRTSIVSCVSLSRRMVS